MIKMKKLVAILLVTVLMVTFLAGCGKGRELYDTADLKDYVEICDYKGIEIDTTSEEYLKLYSYYLYNDMHSNKLSEENIKGAVDFDSSAEAVVEFGDIVNINYVGYIGEEAFEGGSDEEALLTIGSGNFIDDFEDQLVGAKPGQTVDVNVTFPDKYPNNPDLAGTRAKFVVTVNSVAKNPEQIYTLFNLESQNEYVGLLNKRAQKSFVFNFVVNNSKIKNYPEDDVEIFYEAAVEYYQEVYGADISSGNKEETLNDLIYPTMKENIVMYYILDAEQLEIYESTIESQGVANSVVAESYAVNEIVMEYLLDNAKIK